MLLTDWKLGLLGIAFVPLIAFRAIIVSTRMRGIWPFSAHLSWSAVVDAHGRTPSTRLLKPTM
ncbi:MAG TPA: ABC transporter ATP-binding protein [Planctomycetes bacterium]|nr:ABC transporter ATP-binding protein [Planctomycetota bacterium]